MAEGSSEGSGAPYAGGTGHGVFATTHWSLVISARDLASPESAEALERLCQLYWSPLYAFIRKSGFSPADAEDLTQGFFARLLQKDYIRTASREKGRFRTFLLTALKAYMANEWDRQHAQKRGGFAQVISIDQTAEETRLGNLLADPRKPDDLYDRQWTLTLLQVVIGQLRSEYETSGRAKLFEHLQNAMAGEDCAIPYAEVAMQLGLTESAVKMASYRLRSRYRELLREQVAQTVSSSEEVDSEIRALFAAFGS